MSSRYRHFSDLTHCLVLSVVLHAVTALLLNLKSGSREVVVSGNSMVVTAILMPVNKRVATPPLPVGDRANRLVNNTDVPTAVAQEKKPVAKEAQPVEAIPTPSTKRNTLKRGVAANAASDEGIAPNNASQITKPAAKPSTVSKAPAVTDRDTGKRSNRLQKGAEKSQNRSEKPGKQQGKGQAPLDDVDRLFDNLAARCPTRAVSAGQNGMSHYQCSQYAAQIKNAIQSNLIKDSRHQGKNCEIALQLSATGAILNAQLRKGDPAVCAAALRAVGMTGSVPKPTDKELYEAFKNVVISFEL